MKNLSKKSKRAMFFYFSFALWLVGIYGKTYLHSCMEVLGAVYMAALFFQIFTRIQKAQEAHPKYHVMPLVFPFLITINMALCAIFGITKAAVYPDYPASATNFITGFVLANMGIIAICFLYRLWSKSSKKPITE